MKLKIFRSLWGVIPSMGGQQTLEGAFKRIKALGYDGIETPYKVVLEVGVDKFKSLLQKNNLEVIMLLLTDGIGAPGGPGLCGGPYPGHPKPGPTVADHVAVFTRQVEASLEFNPVFINSHSGKDHFSMAQGEEFFGRAVEVERRYGVDIGHETHRGRFLYSPWVARDFLARHPEVKLVADLSHWVNVTECNTEDDELNKAIRAIAPHVRHMHCRVGYEHGPQVSDPRAPEWQPYLNGHEKWWDLIWDQQKKNGLTGAAPEHGPPTYQHTMPGTQQPLADIWDVNHFIGLRQQERFAKKFGTPPGRLVADK